MTSPSGTDGTLLKVRVQPRASRNEIAGWRGDALGVRVTAPPVAGQANAAVTAVVAQALGVRVTAVTLVRGQRGRDKVLRVAGVSPTQVRARLARGEGGER